MNIKVGDSVISSIAKTGIGVVTSINSSAQTVQVRFPRISMEAKFTLNITEVTVVKNSPMFSQAIIQEAEEIFYTSRDSGLFQEVLNA